MKDIRFEELDTDSGQIDPEDEGLLEELMIDDADTADTADAADDDLFEEFEIGEAAADTKPETVFVKAQEETPEPETEETAEAETAEAAETETVPSAEDAREESKEPEPETEETAEAETAEAAETETVPSAEDAAEISEEPEPEAEETAEAEAVETEEPETAPAAEDAAEISEEPEPEAEEAAETEAAEADKPETAPAAEDAQEESEEPESEEVQETQAEEASETEAEEASEPEDLPAKEDAAEENAGPLSAAKEAPAAGETDEPLPIKPFWSEEEEEESGPVGIVKLVSFLLVFAVLLAGAYVYGIGYYGTHFLPNTFLDGVDVGELTAAEAKEALRNSFEENTFELTGRNGASESLDISEAEPSREYEGIEQVLSGQNRIGWIVARKPVKETMLPYTGTFDEEGLERALDASKTLDPANIASPEDAYISFDEAEDRYVITPEKPGNAVDREILSKAMQAKIQEGRMQLDLEEIGCYISPAVSSDNARLQRDLTELNTLQDLHASIDMGGETVEYLSGEKLRELISAENAVQDYVTGLKDRYDTFDKERRRLFRTQEGTYILISAAYGWKLDEEATLTDMTTLVQSAADAVSGALGESSAGSSGTEALADAAGTEEDAEGVADPFHIAATWKNKAVVHEEADYGTTYAEVDLTNQTVYVIQDGETIFTSPCVSGRMTKDRKTPPGIFDIKLKQTNKVLVGYKPDGSVDYRSPVSYWMPFNGGVGFHDATWRGSFGGTIYVHSGSHGCINMPLAKARELYGIVYKGMPVIVYYR